MNASTASSKISSGPNADSAVRRLFRNICRGLRRSLELAGEPYRHGGGPPP
jgi:hypothetical protein